MDADLDRYLKQSQLTIFVFDDRDQKDDRYVARADIPLIPLAHDNQIRGTIDMYTDQGSKNGTIDVILKWTYTYILSSTQRLKSSSINSRSTGFSNEQRSKSGRIEIEYKSND